MFFFYRAMIAVLCVLTVCICEELCKVRKSRCSGVLSPMHRNVIIVGGFCGKFWDINWFPGYVYLSVKPFNDGKLIIIHSQLILVH